MKLSIEIPNEQLASKVIWFLGHLKSEGVKFAEIPLAGKDVKTNDAKEQLLSNSAIVTAHEQRKDREKRQYSHEYITKNWRELIMTFSIDPLQDDDKILQEEYGEFLSAKHSS